MCEWKQTGWVGELVLRGDVRISGHTTAYLDTVDCLGLFCL
jgi:hypothetical protein